jgi:hypothetical protein
MSRLVAVTLSWDLHRSSMAKQGEAVVGAAAGVEAAVVLVLQRVVVMTVLEVMQGWAEDEF